MMSGPLFPRVRCLPSHFSPLLFFSLQLCLRDLTKRGFGLRRLMPGDKREEAKKSQGDEEMEIQ